MMITKKKQKIDKSYDKVYYSVTLTFRPEFTVKDKFKKIKHMYKHFYAVTNWEYSIEYFKHNSRHPFAGKDNPCNPHIHCIFQMDDKPNRLLNVEMMINYFRTNFGRTDFQVLHTDMDVEKWTEYIRKDNERLNLLYPTIIHNVKKENNVIVEKEIEPVNEEDY